MAENRFSLSEPEDGYPPSVTVYVRGEPYQFAHPDDPRWEFFEEWVKDQLNPYFRLQEFIHKIPPAFRQDAIGYALEQLRDNPEGPPPGSPEYEQIEHSIKGMAQYLHYGFSIANLDWSRNEIKTFVGQMTLPEYRAIRYPEVAD